MSNSIATLTITQVFILVGCASAPGPIELKPCESLEATLVPDFEVEAKPYVSQVTTGFVRLGFEVDPDGNVLNAKVLNMDVRPNHQGMEAKAESWMNSVKFSPVSNQCKGEFTIDIRIEIPDSAEEL